MAARPLLSRIRSTVAIRCASLTLAVLVVISPILSAAPARAYDLDESGKWTPRAPWQHLAVHMALLRGDGPHHSKILHYFGLDHIEFFGGLWGWRPAEYTCSSYPDTNALVPLGFDNPGNGATLFCSGMTTLDDGRLFMAGGSQSGTEFGIRRAFTFDAHADSGDAWTELDSMASYRWYPTNTLLADGRVLVTTGSHDHHTHFFGGLKGSDAVPLDSAIFRYGNGQGGRVDPAVRTSSTPLWPSPRVGHSAVFVDAAVEEQTRVFGGKNQLGGYVNDLWQLTRKLNGSSADYDYAWNPLTPEGTPPSPRWRHSAVNVSNPFFKMVVFGGTKEEDSEDVASDEVKVLFQNFFEPTEFEWIDVTVTNPSLL